MTEQEAIASVNFIQDFKLTQYMLAIASGIVISLAGAIVFMYRDNRSERKEWRADLTVQNDRLNQTLERVADALNGVETSNENLAKLVDRQETSTRRLELLITEKLK